MNEIPDLTIASRRRAGDLLCANPGRFQYLISMGDPGEPKPLGFGSISRSLRLEFDDLTYADAPKLGRYRATKSDVRELIDFCRRVDAPVLIHCSAGVSRSPAAACILAAVKLGAGKEIEAIQHVAYLGKPPGEENPYWPNYHMLTVADEILGREGRLPGAVEETYPNMREHREDHQKG